MRLIDAFAATLAALVVAIAFAAVILDAVAHGADHGTVDRPSVRHSANSEPSP